MSWQILKLGKLIGEYPDSWTESAARTALQAFRKQYGSGLKLSRNPGRKSSRFDRCVEDVSARGEVDDPAAVCAAALRRTGWKPRRNPERTFIRQDAAERFASKMRQQGYFASVYSEPLDPNARTRRGRARKTYIVRYDTGRGLLGNPAESASALSESFHGRPEESESVINEAVHVHSHLSDLGGMEEIRLAKGRGKIRFGHDVRLASNENGSQLFLIGGDQSVDLAAYPELDATKECVVLGRVKSVTYNTAKFHLGRSDRKPGPYVHQMGEESRDQPELMYDTVNKRLSFIGGHYQVRPEGIVD